MLKSDLMNWDELRKDLFTSDEIAIADAKISLISSIIDARNEDGITQQKLEKLSGVSQPVIARLETFKTDPQLSTIIKILGAIGKTLAIVPQQSKR